jgi:hypothetical protein
MAVVVGLAVPDLVQGQESKTQHGPNLRLLPVYVLTQVRIILAVRSDAKKRVADESITYAMALDIAVGQVEKPLQGWRPIISY